MKNHIATQLRLAAAATLGAALLGSPGLAQKTAPTELETAVKRLDAATAPIVLTQDSQSPGAVSLAATSPEYMATLVQELLASDIPDRIGILGEAAAPELVRLANELDLVKLGDPQPSNPFVQLQSHLPEAALEFLMQLQVSSPLKFEALVREGTLPMKLVNSALLNDELKVRLSAFVTATVKNEQLPLPARLHEAVQAYRQGVNSSAAVSLIRAHPAQARGVSSSGTRRLYELLYPEGTPLPDDIPLRLGEDVAAARRSKAVWMELAKMPSGHFVIYVLARTLDSMRNHKDPQEFNDALDVTIFMLGNKDPQAASRAAVNLKVAMGRDPSPLTGEQILRIAEGIHGRTWEHTTWTSDVPKKLIDSLKKIDGVSDETLERIFRAGLEAKDPALYKAWRGGWTNRMSLRQAVAYAKAALALSPTDQQMALYPAIGTLHATEKSSPERARVALGILRVAQPDAEAVKKRLKLIANDSRRSSPSGRPIVSEMLEALPAEDRLDAVRFLTSFDGEVAEVAVNAVTNWAGVEGSLRSLIADNDESRRVRLFAYVGLIQRGECSSKELETFSDWLIALAQNPTDSHDVLWTFGSLQSTYDSAPISQRQWATITADLLEESSVSEEIAAKSPMRLKTSDDQVDLSIVRRVLDAAEARSADTLGFPGIQFYAVKWMKKRPGLVRPGLLKGWIQRQNPYRSALSVAATSAFPELRKIAEDYYLDRIANIPPGSAQWRKEESESIVNIIIRMPGSEPVVRLLDYTLKSNDRALASYVEERITNKLRLEEAVARWSTLAAGGETVESARAKVMSMLDSEDGEIRVQAIYALGPLEAIEAIPRLLEFVSSENEAEKAAALETLKTLRESTAKKKS